jgi:hypothetical protein
MTTIVFPIEITTPKKLYDPAQKCIYCGNDKDKLSMEHIVPFGIAGDSLILPRASCRKCTEITGNIEVRCLRSMFGNFRIAIGAPTRRPKDRPASVSLRTGTLSEDRSTFKDVQTITISPTEFVYYPSLTFPGAGILEDRAPETDIQYRVNLHTLDNAKDFIRKHGGAVETSTIYPMDFVRMVAKISHSYAIAELGISGFRPYLLGLILGNTKRLEDGLQFIGCEPTTPPAEVALFSIGWNKAIWADGRKLLVVHLRLFSFFNTPVYHIVAGEWDG